LSRPAEASLEIITSEGNRRLVALGNRPVILGRSPDCDVVIEDTFVSAKHARIEPASDGFILKDAGSTNGTWLDGARIEDATPLRPGATVVLGRPGNYRIRFLADAKSATPAAPGPEKSLQEVLEISKVLLSTLDLEEVLGRVLDACLRISRAERGYLFLREGNDLKLRASRGETPGRSVQQQVEFSRSIALRVAKTGKAEFLSDQQDSGVLDKSASIMRLRLETIACVPLKIQHNVVGIVYMDSHERSELPDATGREVMEVLAGLAAVAIENARMVRERVQNERWTAIGRMAASIVHDIRSPLAALRGTAELLHAKVPDAAHREKLKIIIEEVDRLARLSGEMLEFSSQAQPLNSRPISMDQLIRDFLKSVGPRLEQEQIRLETRLNHPGPLLLDQRKVVRLLHNVVGNALEAMKPGGTLTVETKAVEGRGVLSISDTGCGMSPEIAGRVFEPFFSEGKDHGSGLGMPIVRRIVEQHDATIALESSPGGGTRVQVSFPALVPADFPR
jgi:signal transduction histidine kinase